MRFRDLDKIVRDDGWNRIGKKGSHYHYKHPTKPGKLTIPEHGGKEYKNDFVKKKEVKHEISVPSYFLKRGAKLYR